MVDAILEFMTTRHGPHQFYGWVFLVMAMGTLFGSMAAATVRTRLQRTRHDAKTAVSHAELYAEAITSGPNARRVQAQLREVGGALELTLTDSAKLGEAAEVMMFDSILKVEAYLEAHTMLRLGDFRPKST